MSAPAAPLHSAAPSPGWDGALAAEVIAAHSRLDGACLPILHALQEEFGCIPPEAVPMVAEALNISRAEVHGVVTFYHDFRATPPGRHVLKLCRAEACQAMGVDRLSAGLLTRLAIDWGGTTADGSLTVEPAFCLGLCACAPAALLDGDPLGRLDEAALDEVAREARRA
ncbi:formate dehydrogenase subunit gamma [Roseomonas sp. SSH11]|uniref:Formate dehydrogenase subunit gamma n=1 Tax=Pararoseomonas baculiformis TaxID=2820812 RepID=A0ABS4AIQ3_9PROT|nr:formate dehydrogenase subunit gamma [Pararoseomonas baculiformis]MBP0446910.1 formate dehydrogenase subunit gamma [Pararoseomonas baculiformis]